MYQGPRIFESRYCAIEFSGPSRALSPRVLTVSELGSTSFIFFN